MTFLSPVFLWGLSALAIPLLVHLFNLRRHKKVYFSQVRFLKAVSQQVNKTRKIKHFLILLCRLFALACLVLALAQPVFKNKEFKTEDLEKPVGIYVDNSYSMQTNGPNGNPCLSNAISWASDLVKKSPESSRFFLLTNDFSAADNQVYSKNAMLDRLAEIDYSTSFKTAAQIAERVNQSDFKLRNLLLLSDFQKTSFSDAPQLFSDSSLQFALMPLKAANPHNLFVDTVSLANPNVVFGETNTLKIKVKNSSLKESMDTKLRLFMNKALVSQKKIEVPALGSTEVEFSFKLNDAKPHECKLVLDDPFVVFDNEFFFTLNPNPIQQVVVISSSNSKLFFEKAFSLEPFFKLSIFEFGKIDFGQLQKANVVVVDGLSRLDDNLVDYLKKTLANQAVVLLNPDQKLRTPQQISSLSNIVPSLGKVSIREISADEVEQSLAPPNLNNPFFEQIFSQKFERLLTPKAKKLLENLPGEKILTFNDGSSFMSYVQTNPGHIFLMASPMEEGFSDFGRSALFLPVLYKIASYGNSAKERLFFNIGSEFLKITIVSDTLSFAGKMFALSKNDGTSIILPQQLLGNQLVMRNEKTLNKAGIYTLMLGEKPLKPIAVNTDQKESETETLSEEELNKYVEKFANLQVFEPGERPTELLMTQVGLQEHLNLWRYFLAFAILFFVVEMLIIRLFK